MYPSVTGLGQLLHQPSGPSASCSFLCVVAPSPNRASRTSASRFFWLDMPVGENGMAFQRLEVIQLWGSFVLRCILANWLDGGRKVNTIIFPGTGSLSVFHIWLLAPSFPLSGWHSFFLLLSEILFNCYWVTCSQVQITDDLPLLAVFMSARSESL